MIYSRQHETMPRADLEQLQVERLQATLNRVYRNVAFYRDTFDRHSIDVEKVRGLADLRSLPFTTRDELQAAYPYDMFARPLREIVRIHASSTTSGRPIVTGCTRGDITHWAELVARQLAAVGIDEHDVVQVAFLYGLFTGGLGFHYGAERLSASVIPSSPTGQVREQNQIMKDFKATALVTMPSYALTMANLLGEMGIPAQQLFLRVGIFGAEPWSEALRSMLQDKLHIKAYDCYCVGELLGPGIAAECTEQNGLHVNEDHFIVEVIDPATLQPVASGEVGELVFTTITREGCPLIRFRTGDRASLLAGSCNCGRTLVRMSRVQGRTDDTFYCQGARLAPAQVQAVLREVEGIESDCEIVLDRESGVDTMEVKVAVSSGTTDFDDVRKLVHLKGRILQRLEERLGVKAKVGFVEAASLQAGEGEKRQVVVDRRRD